MIQNTFVKRDVFRNYPFGAIALYRQLTAAFSKRPSHFFIAKKFDRVRGHFLDVPDLAQIAGLAVADDFRDPTDPGRYHGQLARLSFESGKPERFELGRQQKDIRHTEVVRDIPLLTYKDRIVVYTTLLGSMNNCRTLGAIAHHYEPYIFARLARLREDIDAVRRSLYRAKVRNMHQEFFTVWCELSAKRSPGRPEIVIRTNEIRDNFDVVKIKCLDRRFL